MEIIQKNIITDSEKEQLKNILSSVPTGVAVLQGKDFVFEFVNQYFTELTGKSGLIGKPGRKALPEFSSQIWDVVANVYESGKSFIIEEFRVLINKSHNIQQETFFNFNIIPLTYSNTNARVSGVLIHLSESTKQVLAAREAKQYAERLNQLLEALPQMAWTALPSGEVNYLNKRWHDYTGQSHGEALGSGWKNVIHPEDQELSFKKWTESLKTGKILIGQHRFKRIIDNQYRWHLNKAVPLRNEEGEIMLWVGTCTDVHDQVTDQMRLMEANAELKKINKDLDSFIYTASHDLKAPMSNIEGLVNVLSVDLKEKQVIDNEQEEILDMISFSICRFQRIIKELSEISHTQKNIFKDIEAVNLNDMVSEIISSFNDFIIHTEASISYDFSSYPTLKFSRTCIKRILTNLISNAIKFKHPERTPAIKITGEKRDGFVAIKVEDNGLGIKNENKERIFEMFKRFQNHTEGSGIGLYIVKRMIENNEGKIFVESEEDKGSTFHVFLKEATE